MNTITKLGCAALAGCVLSGPALAQDEDYARNRLSVGWLHFFTMEDDEELTTQVTPSYLTAAGVLAEEFVSEGTGASVNDGDTLLLAYTRYFTPNWAIELNGGIPIKFDVEGKGVIQPSEDTDVYNINLADPVNNPLATVKQWSPTMLVQYHFGSPKAKLRPYVGAGFTYTWFTDEKLDPDFVQTVQVGLGPVLAAGAGLTDYSTTVTAKASDDLAWAINAGMSYAFNEKWSVNGSLTYLPIETDATIDVRSAATGQLLARSTTTLKVNPLVTSLFVSYAF